MKDEDDNSFGWGCFAIGCVPASVFLIIVAGVGAWHLVAVWGWR